MNGIVNIGLSWDGGKTRRTAVILLVLSIVLALFTVTAPAHPTTQSLSVIVLENPDSDDSARSLVEASGGTVTTEFSIIDGFAASIAEDSLFALQQHPNVATVTPDYPLALTGMFQTAEPVYATGDASLSLKTADSGWTSEPPPVGSGTMYEVTKEVTLASWMWDQGYTGEGIDVALIDSGVAPVYGLMNPAKVVNGPDLSFDAQDESMRYLDAYGHGTHMAGIIAGRDEFAPADVTGSDGQYHFLGMAPDSRIVNVKVAASNGAVDVSQVIAAIDWVVQHRNDDGLNIRVLNLSFGTTGDQSYTIDPLAFAVEAAWDHGIVVVAASGNDGNGYPVRNPAYDPFVIAVGANDPMGTDTARDDVIPSFSNCGVGDRNVDLVAPGRSIVSLRDYGSYIDQNYPGAVESFRFFRGSGTSQAAAVVSGAAALLLDQRPELTPDQVKKILVSSASTIRGVADECQGGGVLNLKKAAGTRTPTARKSDQNWVQSTGTGSLEAARGDSHVTIDGVTLTGEQDIFGMEWNGLSWSGLSWSGLSWSGGTWNNSDWAGADWSGVSWSGLSWSGVSWSGLSWSGLSWSGLSWSTGNWDDGWNGLSWSGLSWSGLSWSGDLWLDK